MVLTVVIKPRNYKEAIQSEQGTHWEKAMEKEIHRLKENSTWKMEECN